MEQNELDKLFNELFNASEEEAFIIENSGLEKEVKNFFGIAMDRFTFDDLKAKDGGRIESERLLNFIIENDLFDKIGGEVTLVLENIMQLEKKETKDIFKKLKIKEIQVKDLSGVNKNILENLPCKFGIYYDALAPGFDKFYSPETMYEILDIMEDIKARVERYASELEKFLAIYKIIAMSAYYHDDEDMNTTRSLKGVLIDGKAVCYGYAVTLLYVLKYVGIEAKIVSGFGHKAPHAWNQVRIDNVWYNTDLTADSDAVCEKRELLACLRNDEVFYSHYKLNSILDVCNIEKCSVDFSGKDIENALIKALPELDDCKENFGKGYRELISSITKK